MKYYLTIVSITILSLTYFACKKSGEVGPKVHLINEQKKLTVLTKATQSFGIRERNQIYYTPTLVTYAFTGGTFSIDEPLPIDDQTDIAMTIALYNELTAIDLERVPVRIDDNLVCKKTAISIRVTKTASIDHLNAFVNSYLESHSNCSKLHGVDSGCLWEIMAVYQLSKFNVPANNNLWKF